MPFQSRDRRESPSPGLYRFSFWSTLFFLVLAMPLSIACIALCQLAVSIWAWLNGPSAANLLSWDYWLFGIEAKPSFLSQMLVESVLAFLKEFICYAAGLLMTFWCAIHIRRRTTWRVSVGAIVVFLSVAYIVFGFGKFAINAYYTWRVYELGILQCNLFSFEFYKCNFVLLEIPRITAALSNVAAAIFAGQVYSRHLDDTDEWVREVTERMERRFPLGGGV